MSNTKTNKRFDPIEKRVYTVLEAAIYWSELEEHKDEIISKVPTIPFTLNTKDQRPIKCVRYCRISIEKLFFQWPGLIDKFDKIILGVNEGELESGVFTPPQVQ